MKKQVIMAALMAVGLAAAAQKEEKQTITNTSQANYTVAHDGKTKEGLYYVKNLKNDGLWVQGHYKNGTRAGVWYFFNGDNKLAMRYNFDDNNLLFVDTTQLGNVSVHVLATDPEIAKNASAPLPLCSIDYYSTLLVNKVYETYDKRSQGLKAEITAHIDAQGRAVYTIVYLDDNNKRSSPQRIAMTSPFSIDWVPSRYNKKALPSEFTVYATVSPDNTSDTGANFKRFRWDQ